jgi:hypothetical protein
MTNDNREQKSSQPNRKRTYQAPRVEETGSFERLALACVKVGGQSFQCDTGGTQS